MEKVDLSTANIAAENAAKLAELFPDVLTEVMDEDGNVRYGIDAEALRAHVGDIAEGKRERYQFTWPGKQRARAEAIRPIDKTMRPCVEESVNWGTTENLYIEGDNLDALKILRETYASKIKMIYIDPPYNTGHDFVYNDSFARSAEEERIESGAFDDEGNVLDKAYKQNNESNGRFHSDWCSMMYPRLVLARDLLSEDGVMYVSIKTQEFENLGKLLREVFGDRASIACITWESVTQPANAGDAKYGAQQKSEFIFLVSKGRRKFVLPVDGISKGYPHVGRFGSCRFEIIEKSDAGTDSRETMKFEILGQKPRPGKRWQIGESTARELERAGRVELVDGIVKKAVYPEDEFDAVSVVPFWSHLDASSYGTAQTGKKELNELMGRPIGFDTVKPTSLLGHLLSKVEPDAVVFDFFSGSATTAHAVMQLNAEDGGNRKFIMVQLPEVCDEKSEAAKAGYSNICEIGKERIRRAGAKIAAEVEQANAQLKLGEEPKKVPDIGFRVLKIDSSNFKDVKSTPDAIQQDQLFGMADNLKPDRTPEDILFQLVPQFEIPFTARIEKLSIGGKTVYSVDDDTLLACFDREVSEDVIRTMAERQPLRAVLRDASFIGDDALTNFEEIFKTLSPSTETRVV